MPINMETKKFGDKQIIIRKPEKADMKNAKKFQDFINFLVKEDAKILMNEPATLKEEKEYIANMLRGVKNKNRVYLIAECDKKIIGTVSIESERWRRSHIGIFSIAISSGYRGLGLGKYLMSEIIKLAKAELNPKPTILRLEAYSNNKPAIGLYKKMGLKIIAKIPSQIQYKGKLVSEFIMIRKI